MNADSAKTVILSALGDYSIALFYICGAVLTIGVGYLVYKIGWGYIRNMPGDWTYNSQRASYRFGHGKKVAVHSGNMLG